MSAVAHAIPGVPSFSGCIKSDEQMEAETKAHRNVITISKFQSGIRFCNDEHILELHRILTEQAENDAGAQALLDHIMMETPIS